MKKLFCIVSVIVLTFSLSCSQTSGESGDTKKSSVPEITFEETTFDYGTVEYGGNGVHEFVFKNTGKEPLILSNVQSSCGCTIPVWPKEPIKKGDKGIIKVSYDTKRPGAFTKGITVYSNASTPSVALKITGTVQPNPKDPGSADLE